MRTVFWLTAFTLVAASVTTIAVADYVYRHPNSILSRCVAHLVDGEKAPGGTGGLSASGCHDEAPCVVPPAHELAQLAGLANETTEVARFPEPIALPPLEQLDAFEGAAISLAPARLSSDLDIPIQEARSGLTEPVELLAVMPRPIEDVVEVLQVYPRPVDDDSFERIGIDFNEECPKTRKSMRTKNGVISVELRLQATPEEDCCECPCASFCKTVCHCLFGWMVGVDCYQDCVYAGMKQPVKHPADWERRPHMAVNGGECSKACDLPGVHWERLVSVDYRNTPLHQVMDDLRTLTGMNVVADRPALEKAGVSLERGVWMQLKDVKLTKALELVLRDAHCCYTIEDNIILVTTPCQAKGKLTQCIYPVAELVAGMDGKDRERSQSLMHLIAGMIEPTSWDMLGGGGHIDYFPLGMSLVVNQTADVQEQVQLLLDRLRELTDRQLGAKQVDRVKVVKFVHPVQDLVMAGCHPEQLRHFVCQALTAGCAKPQHGVVEYFPLGMSLVVTQTPEFQTQIEQLLNRLREMQGRPEVLRLMPPECDIPYCEPPGDDYIDMEADEVELHFGKLKLRCKNFRMSVPAKAVGMLKGRALDPVCDETCCEQGCCEEKDLVAEFMALEPLDFSADELQPAPAPLPFCDDPLLQLTDPEQVFRSVIREVERSRGGVHETATPEKLPVCDHDRVCPASGKFSLPFEEEIIQADFEVGVEPKQNEEPPVFTIEFVPGIYIEGAGVYRIDGKELKRVEQPKKAPKDKQSPSPKPEAKVRRDIPAYGLWSRPEDGQLSWETERDGLVRLRSGWPIDVSPASTPDGMHVPDWAEDLFRAVQDAFPAPENGIHGDFATGDPSLSVIGFSLPRYFLAENKLPAGIEIPHLDSTRLPASLKLPVWARDIVRSPSDSDIFSFWLGFFR